MSKKIKNWKIPRGKKKGRKTTLGLTLIHPEDVSVRIYHCLIAMKIFRLKDVCIPDVWYASKVSWTTIMLNQTNFGRKAYNELVDYLVSKGLVPIYEDQDSDSEDYMTGALMR